MGLITVIGSLNMDLVVRMPTLPRAGETLAGSDFHLIPGGKGANQAMAVARAGANTRMVGCVGTDAFAAPLLDSLQQAGIDTAPIQKLDQVTTGTATILIENGDNRIIVVAGANGKLTPEIIQNQWSNIRSSDWILLQNEIPLDTVFGIIERAYADGIRIIYNPAPVYPIPQPILQKVDILIVNELEAGALTNILVNDKVSARSAAQTLHGQGADSVIVTLGSGGAVLYNTHYDLFQPAFSVPQVDTTAAGDTFTGSYAACILAGHLPPAALNYAAGAAALAVTRLGAQTSIPYREEVEEFLANQAAEIGLIPVDQNNGGGQSQT